MSLLGRELNGFIAVKRARIGEDERADHANEQKMFQLLENYPPIPYLRYQERELHDIQVLKVSQALAN
jgi:hypothetical protein